MSSISADLLTQYAAIAANVYQLKNPATKSPPNLVSAPPGWTVINAIATLPSDSFAGAAYSNNATNQLVIAFAGTDSSNFADKQADGGLGLGLIPTLVPNVLSGLRNGGIGNNTLSIASAALQQLQGAVSIYNAVASLINPTTGTPYDISFTGHSLGGGLASLMGVYFNKPAIVFDNAPFKASSGASTVSALLHLSANQGLSQQTIGALQSYIASASSSASIPNINNVQSYSIARELLSGTAPFDLLSFVEPPGTRTQYSVGKVGVTNTDLHAIDLLAAVTASSSFATGMSQLSVGTSVLLHANTWLNPLELGGIGAASDFATLSNGDILPVLLNKSNTGVANANPFLNDLGTDFQNIAAISGSLSPTQQLLLTQLCAEFQMNQPPGNTSNTLTSPASSIPNGLCVSAAGLCQCPSVVQGNWDSSLPNLESLIGGTVDGTVAVDSGLSQLASSDPTATITLQFLLPNASSLSILEAEAADTGPLGAATRFALLNGSSIIATNLVDADSVPSYGSEPAAYWNAKACELIAEIARASSSGSSGPIDTRFLSSPTATNIFIDQAAGLPQFSDPQIGSGRENQTVFLSNGSGASGTIDESHDQSSLETIFGYGAGNQVRLGGSAAVVYLGSGGGSNVAGGSGTATIYAQYSSNDTILAGAGTTTIVAGNDDTITTYIGQSAGQIHIEAASGDVIDFTGEQGTVSFGAGPALTGGTWNQTNNDYEATQGGVTYHYTTTSSGLSVSNGTSSFTLTGDGAGLLGYSALGITLQAPVAIANTNDLVSPYVPPSATQWEYGVTGQSTTLADGNKASAFTVGLAFLPFYPGITGWDPFAGNEISEVVQTNGVTQLDVGGVCITEAQGHIQGIFLDPPDTAYTETFSGSGTTLSSLYDPFAAGAGFSAITPFAPSDDLADNGGLPEYSTISAWPQTTYTDSLTGTTVSTANGVSDTITTADGATITFSETQQGVLVSAVGSNGIGGSVQVPSYISQDSIPHFSGAGISNEEAPAVVGPVFAQSQEFDSDVYNSQGELSEAVSSMPQDFDTTTYNADGTSSTQTFAAPEDSTPSAVTNMTADGSIASTLTVDNGVATEIQNVADNGSINTQSAASNVSVTPDGTITFGSLASVTTTTTQADGSWSSDTTNPDGSSSSESEAMDGTYISYSYDSQGNLLESTVEQPSGASVNTTLTDDIVWTTSLDPAGIVSSVLATNPDGSTFYSRTQNSDGSYSVTQTGSDGQTTIQTDAFSNALSSVFVSNRGYHLHRLCGIQYAQHIASCGQRDRLWLGPGPNEHGWHR